MLKVKSASFAEIHEKLVRLFLFHSCFILSSFLILKDSERKYSMIYIHQNQYININVYEKVENNKYKIIFYIFRYLIVILLLKE